MKKKKVYLFVSSAFLVIGIVILHLWVARDLLNQKELFTHIIKTDEVFTSEPVHVNPNTPSRLVVQAIVDRPSDTQKTSPPDYSFPVICRVLSENGETLERIEAHLTRPALQRSRHESESDVIGEHFLERFRTPDNNIIRISFELGEMESGAGEIDAIGLKLMDNTNPRFYRMIAIFVLAFTLWALWLGKVMSCKKCD